MTNVATTQINATITVAVLAYAANVASILSLPDGILRIALAAIRARNVVALTLMVLPTRALLVGRADHDGGVMKHIHEYRKGRGTVDICSCGRFRHNEKAGPPIVEQTATKHTPGPWKAESELIPLRTGSEVGYVHHGSTIVAQTWIPGNGASHEQQTVETLANAQIIAAAPEMLNALNPFADVADSIPDSWQDDKPVTCSFKPSQLRAARAAIAKATGVERG